MVIDLSRLSQMLSMENLFLRIERNIDKAKWYKTNRCLEVNRANILELDLISAEYLNDNKNTIFTWV